jgi:hypothetical protein
MIHEPNLNQELNRMAMRTREYALLNENLIRKQDSPMELKFYLHVFKAETHNQIAIYATSIEDALHQASLYSNENDQSECLLERIKPTSITQEDLVYVPYLVKLHFSWTEDFKYYRIQAASVIEAVTKAQELRSELNALKYELFQNDQLVLSE